MTWYSEDTYIIHINRWIKKKHRSPLCVIEGRILIKTKKAYYIYGQMPKNPHLRCCLCGKELTVERSVLFGVGKYCALKFWKKHHDDKKLKFSEMNVECFREFMENFRVGFWVPMTSVKSIEPSRNNVEIPSGYKIKEYKKRKEEKKGVIPDHTEKLDRIYKPIQIINQRYPDNYYYAKVYEKAPIMTPNTNIITREDVIKALNKREDTTMTNSINNVKPQDISNMWKFCRNCGTEYVRSMPDGNIAQDGLCKVCKTSGPEANKERYEMAIRQKYMVPSSSCRCNTCGNKTGCEYKFHPDCVDNRCKLIMEQNGRTLPSTNNLNKIGGTTMLYGKERLDAIFTAFIAKFPTARVRMSKSGKTFWSVPCSKIECRTTMKKGVKTVAPPEKGPVHAFLFEIDDPKLGKFFASVCNKLPLHYELRPAKSNPNQVLPAPATEYSHPKTVKTDDIPY